MKKVDNWKIMRWIEIEYQGTKLIHKKEITYGCLDLEQLESSYAHISDDYVIFSFIIATVYYVNDKSSISFLLT